MSNELVDFVEQHIGDEYIVKESSGRSRVYVTPLFALKVYEDEVDIERELNAVTEINSKFVIRIYKTITTPSIRAIMYETVTPITNIIEFNNHESYFFNTLLCSVAHALFDIHSHGYKHGDVAKGNIGRNDEGGIVLYDTEDLILGTDEEMFGDVMMFLEDMQFHYKNTENDYIQQILQVLFETMSSHRQIQERTVSFLGKQRTRSTSVVEYSCSDFVDAIVSHIDTCSL